MAKTEGDPNDEALKAMARQAEIRFHHLLSEAEFKTLCAQFPQLFQENVPGEQKLSKELRHAAAAAACKICPLLGPCRTAARLRPLDGRWEVRAGELPVKRGPDPGSRPTS